MITPDPSNLTETPSWLESTEINTEYRWSLLAMMIFLALVLLFMLILLCLPKSAQDTVVRWITRQNPDQSFNYIDVGLYKTRHSMYRKEVYSLAMQSNHLQRSARAQARSSVRSSILSKRLKHQCSDNSITSLNHDQSPDHVNRSDVTCPEEEEKGTTTARLSAAQKPEVVVTLITNETGQGETNQSIQIGTQSENRVIPTHSILVAKHSSASMEDDRAGSSHRSSPIVVPLSVHIVTPTDCRIDQTEKASLTDKSIVN